MFDIAILSLEVNEVWPSSLHSLTNRYLRQVLKMGIRCTEYQTVLNDKSRDPQIVCRDHNRFLPKLQINLRVVIDGLFIRSQN